MDKAPHGADDPRLGTLDVSAPHALRLADRVLKRLLAGLVGDIEIEVGF